MKLTSVLITALSLLAAVDAKKCHKAGQACENVGNRACQCNSGDLVRFLSDDLFLPTLRITDETPVAGIDPVCVARGRKLLHQSQDLPQRGQ